MTNIVPVVSEKDIAATANLAKIIWTEHYTPIIGKEQVDYMLDKFQSVTAIQDQLNRGIKYCLLQRDHTFVGYFSFDIKEEFLFLSKLYVLKSARGNGLSKAGLSFMEEEAKTNSLSTIRLTVNKYNSSSIAAYQKMGFTTIGPVVQDIGNGFVMDDYVLEKRIAF